MGVIIFAITWGVMVYKTYTSRVAFVWSCFYKILSRVAGSKKTRINCDFLSRLVTNWIIRSRVDLLTKK
jgi:steroid 5-alpha reductase family enzyme